MTLLSKRGISGLVAVIILIFIVVLAGAMILFYFGEIFKQTRSVRISVESSALVCANGRAVFSIVLKNEGTVSIILVKVKLADGEEATVASADSLHPLHRA